MGILKLLAFMAIWATTFETALAQTPQDADKPRMVNVTSDSPLGWVPTEDDEQRAVGAANEFLDAGDEGRTSAAYGMMSDVNRAQQSASEYTDRVTQFNLRAGRNIFHHIVKITWTKDPPQGPFPGIYAAIDIASRYANIDRECGYLVLYQAPGSTAFTVMREEVNFLDNVTASQIVREHSQAEVDRLWAQLSSNCPNYSQADESH